MIGGPALARAGLVTAWLLIAAQSPAAAQAPDARPAPVTRTALLGWCAALLALSGAGWAASAHVAPRWRRRRAERARIARLLAALERAQRARMAERERNGLRRRRSPPRDRSRAASHFEGGVSFLPASSSPARRGAARPASASVEPPTTTATPTPAPAPAPDGPASFARTVDLAPPELPPADDADDEVSDALLARLRALGGLAPRAGTIDLGPLDLPGGETLDLGPLDLPGLEHLDAGTLVLVPDAVLARLQALAAVEVPEGSFTPIIDVRPRAA